MSFYDHYFVHVCNGRILFVFSNICLFSIVVKYEEKFKLRHENNNNIDNESKHQANHNICQSNDVWHLHTMLAQAYRIYIDMDRALWL